MPLEAFDSIDAIGIDKISGHVVLTIADSWEWCDEQEHLIALQRKLNAYLGFLQSGQICGVCPDAEGRQVRISIVFRFTPPAKAINFLATVKEVVSELHAELSFETFSLEKN